VVRIHGTDRGLALTADCTPRYCAADPREGGRQAVAEAWRNLSAAGARPLAITDCMNFGSPERAEIMGQFAACIEGMADACRALDFPVVSGNVSFYNETEGTAIQPTPEIGGVGLIDDLDRVATPAFRNSGDALVLVGRTRGHVGASLYLRELVGREGGAPPPVDLDAERRNGDFVRGLIQSGRVTACHDVSDGGLYVAVAEMAMASGIGAALALPPSDIPLYATLFGEDQARYVLAIPEDTAAAIVEEAENAQIPAANIGSIGGADLTVNGDWPISVNGLRAVHEAWMPAFMAR
jgi:phosphoribosylformylglycinamidine synthase